MYLSFFNLREQPFKLTPDPRFLFMSRSHREAFDHLLFGIHQRRGFIEVVGGIGTGKTTLCRAVLEELAGSVATALIFNTFLSELELLRAVNEEFGIQTPGETRRELIDALNGFLIDNLAKRGNACLILDECQNLQVPVLEQIRMLSNLETESDKLLQIVMVGQPEFHEILKSPGLRQLDERIHVRSFLAPLAEDDARGYIEHRLSVAGSNGDIHFSEGALREIYGYSQGNPRRINTVCDRCLLIAYSRDTFRITRDHARKALEELHRGVPPRMARHLSGRPSTRRTMSWPLMAALGVGGVLVGWLLAQTFIFGLPGFFPSEVPPTPQTVEAPVRVTELIQETPPPVVEDPALARQDSQQADPLFADVFSTVRPPPDGMSVEEAARMAGMEATHLTLSWEDLLRFRRPCLLELSPPKASPRYGVLRGISQRGAWIQEGDGGLQFVPYEALLTMWFGGVWLRLPVEEGGQPLRPRAQGERVVRLQGVLERLGYWKGVATGIYDEDTQRAVMAFQRDLHLNVDGIVGPKTRGMMLQVLGEDGERL